MSEHPDEKQAATLEKKRIGRWTLLRDLAVFQAKLFVDGLRDLVLIPLSLIAGVIDIILGANRSRKFYDVVVLGKRSESWINLFSAARRVSPPHEQLQVPREESIDAVVDSIESRILEQYERGGVTAKAKDAIDRTLDAIQKNQAD